ncbi:imidazoleglycerol-phosphate dehydratase [Anseongella ginsenosidimutans]|uniref:Histidine biosynthesis bifunctional protein HisB n=1 Tax=Anseongella ginsenosidimutans TaxID=496056 RepID=A0A4R3KUA2_9SPHI|nr:bifunctional histidinol-phosphatase/imidazoleglycerol-phosphate dehydratase HisB [Anseongella ginsenosidimutans]QEC52972.1 bifunctional histidinol-phosphatase/imidazoleglycerol-phosphate dehydratase HisB [Anseongella ginsenosidimutans]TCS87375.1 imidazoleglycerol-phosphate dehydratase [Anseongella ginsenosidimutans]
MKKVLFIDRDGTIIAEPPFDFQVDSLEKLEFLPYAISSLKKLQDYGYELLMVSNQDGRGTDSFPEEDFLKPQEKMLTVLRNEGVEFAEIFIDPSFEHENSPNRKPNTGLLVPYLARNQVDMTHSYVIGDRYTDVQLAKNLGCKSIRFGPENDPEADISLSSWQEITAFLCKGQNRRASLERNTKETRIRLLLDLDGAGTPHINTGLKFYDHMLDQLVKHSGIDLELNVEGDLEVDEHHTIEDTAIALGQAFRQALGDKRGIERYGFLLPMDEALIQCAIDLSGRAWMVFKGSFKREYVGDFPTEMFEHWLKSFSDNAGINLNLHILEGQNDHHKIEASFKALAKCIKQAIKITSDELPTTKGTL